MINDLKKASLMEAIIYGIQLSTKEQENKLISYTEAFNGNPISFYMNGSSLNLNYRQFWSDPEGFTLVGVGSTTEFVAHGDSRFDDIKLKWDQFIKENQINIEHQATGPILMGGFSFNPNFEQKGDWENYKSASMVMPRFLLTKKENQAFLTINLMVSPDDQPDQLLEEVLQQKKQLEENDHSHKQSKEKFSLAITPLRADEWKMSVQKAIDKLNQGVLEKIVLSRSLSVENQEEYNIATILQNLREQQPTSFVFAIERGQDTFIGATPERLVKRDGNQFYADALAGTAPRSIVIEEDEKLANELMNDKKNRDEHQYVVQMIQGVFDKVCEDIVIPDRPVIYKTRDVQHLYTPVYGSGKQGAHLLDAVKQMHPTPAMGGTPKERAIELIEQLETYERGWYSAPIGWIDTDGNGDFSVAIRSGLIRKNKAVLFAGCGIVGASTPEAEYQETEIKFRPMLGALGGV